MAAGAIEVHRPVGRRRAAVVVVVAVLAAWAPPLVAQPGAVRGVTARDWSGTYDGRFTDTTGPRTKVLENAVHLEVEGLKVSGSFRLRATENQTPYADEPEFTIDVCSFITGDLTADVLTGIPVEGDEVQWTGELTLMIGTDEESNTPCRAVKATDPISVKIEMTVGSAGLRGTLSSEGNPSAFVAKRTGGPAPPPAATTPTEDDSSSGGTSTKPTLSKDDEAKRKHILAVATALSPGTRDLVERRLDEIGEISGIDDSDVESVTRMVGGGDTDLAQLALLALGLAHAKLPAVHGVKADAFPNVAALGPVLMKLLANAANKNDDGTARSALRRLLDLAVQLDVDG